MERDKEIERSIIKRFRNDIWKRFIQALNEYKLIEDGDNVAVCISGGKDSMLLAKCMQEVQRHGKIKFEMKFIVMNPGYSEKTLEKIKGNLEILNIPAEIFSSNIFEVVDSQTGGSPCYLCARMRRGFLYNKAKELGCNKIALGHHFDDVIETLLLSMFYGSEIKTMMPKLHSDNFENMELIRPLYMVKEHDILSWVRYNNLEFIRCACKFTEKVAEVSKEDESKRKVMKKLIEELRKTNDNIDMNIFKSLHNVNIDALPGIRKDGQLHSFLELYDEKNT
ncbi:MAG: ATP-binding protein, partial [Clostridia bacterium]